MESKHRSMSAILMMIRFHFEIYGNIPFASMAYSISSLILILPQRNGGRPWLNEPFKDTIGNGECMSDNMVNL
jgi:hypothetical protein